MPLCARIHSPPSWSPRPRPGRSSRGVSTHFSIPSLLGPLTFPQAKLLSVASAPRTRARVGTHTPSQPEHPSERRTFFLHPLYLFVQPRPWLIRARLVHPSSQGGKSLFFVLNTDLKPLPLTIVELSIYGFFGFSKLGFVGFLQVSTEI